MKAFALTVVALFGGALAAPPCPPPVTCGDNEMACAPPPGAMEAAAEAGSCPPPPMCMPSTYENDGVTCASWCPMPPPPDAMVPCPPVTNAEGCMMPPIWMPSLAECPAGPPAMRKAPCPPPVTCGEDEMACAPPPGAMEAAAEAGACPPPPMCMPSTYENDGVTCASWCPMPPPPDAMVACPPMTNADGCMMPPLWMPSLDECPAGPPAMRKAPCPPPVTCGDNEMACAPPPGAMEAAAEAGACPPPPMCMPSTYENDGVTCASWCPMPPPPDAMVPCPPVTNADGCMMPPLWMPSAAECPAGPPAMRKAPCPPPKKCGDDEMACAPPPEVIADAAKNGSCMPPPMCIPQSYELEEATCYNFCPMPAPKDQVPCPAMTNPDGCPMPPIWAPSAAECPVAPSA